VLRICNQNAKGFKTFGRLEKGFYLKCKIDRVKNNNAKGFKTFGVY